MASRTPRELPSGSTAVDEQDEPSAQWGWHGSFPMGSTIAGWATVVILLTFLVGNHTGRIEDIWLIGVAVVLAGAMIVKAVKRRNAWRR